MTATPARRVAICSPLRTPVGRFLGTLAPLEAGQLGAIIIRALVERSGVVGSSRVDLQACKLEYSIVSPK